MEKNLYHIFRLYTRRDEIKQTLKRIPFGAWAILFLLLAVWLPYMSFMNRSRMSVAVVAGIYVMLGLSLNIIVGYAGLFQLGHAAFFGLGAYTAAILSIEYNWSILATIPIAALVAGIMAVLISKPILHLRGDYLCIVTIAFGEIFRIAVTNNLFGITGGSNGLSGVGRPDFPLPWLEPVPIIMLVVCLALHVYLSRKSGPILQWSGAGLLALAYYSLPLGLGHDQFFIFSIVMVLTALVIGTMLREQGIDVQRQIITLVIVVAVFVLLMVIGGDQLAASIDGNIEKYFKPQDPVKKLGVEWTPVTFKRNANPYYFLVLGFIVLTVVGMRRLQNSRLGRAWLYVREDQLAAEAMGIDTTHIKMIAFVLGSAWAGVAGVLYAGRFTVVAPESFNFLQSVIMFCIVVLGGSGSIPGILVGTLGMVVLPELLRDVGPAFLFEGRSPVIILAIILGVFLYNARKQFQPAVIVSGAIVAAYVLPSLILDIPSLHALGLLMALVVIIGITIARQKHYTGNTLPWVLGAVTFYVGLMTVIGDKIGPDLESTLLAFKIMDWRDGLIGLAMVVMMVLRPAGIIPERRQGIVVSTVAQSDDAVPVTAMQPTT